MKFSNVRVNFTEDHYNVTDLVKLCDNTDCVVVPERPTDTTVRHGVHTVHIKTIVRTAKDNKVLVPNDVENGSPIIPLDNNREFEEGTTFNDCAMYLMADLIKKVFANDLESAAYYTLPTPFGIHETKNIKTALFQIVCKEEKLPAPIGYHFVSVDSEQVKDLLFMKQFVKTKTEE